VDFSKKLSKIESHEFAADLSLASDYKIYLRILKEHKAVQDLLKAFGYNKNKSKLIQRIIELSELVIDNRYENPWDVALSAYLWVLSQKDMKLAQVAAEVAAKVPNCWWTIRISQDVIRM